MFCEVILSQRFPKHLGIFDYEVPASLSSDIKIGQLVSMLFRNRERDGVVLKIKEQPIFGKKIQPISKILNAEPILTPEQIQVAEWISQYYFVSLGTVVKMMLPPIPKRAARKKPITASTEHVTVGANTEISALVHTLSKKTGGASLFWPINNEQQNQFFAALFAHNSGATLVVVPEIQDCQRLKNFLPPNHHDDTVMVHSQLAKNEMADAYQRIMAGRAQLIIGTKIALLAPVRHLRLIVIDQEDNINHKSYDQNPRFDARTTAKHLALLHHSQICYVSEAPTVERYEQLQRGALEKLSTKTKCTPSIQIIDLKSERTIKNFTPFSSALTDAAERTLAGGRQIFLFINKTGDASSVTCRDCGHVLACERCKTVLTYHETSTTLYCHGCSMKSQLPPFCPRCSGVNFRFGGMGTQKVEREAKRQWPKYAIDRIDRNTKNLKRKATARIIIGTEQALEIVNWKTVGLVGVISADTLLYLPDFRAAERTWQILNQIMSQSNAPVIVQTYSPHHALFRALEEQNPDRFYASELADRQALHYPPYTQLIRLIYQHHDKKQCGAEIQRFLRVLKTSPLDAHELVPLQPFQHGMWRLYIIMKYQSPAQDQLLRTVLKSVPDSWVIDRDPVSLL